MATSNQNGATAAGNAYDLVPYPSASFPQSHPKRLAAMGRLFGLNVPPPSSARVLELGCADGANLLPLADQLPGARFLGIDASRVQIETGQKAMAAAGLQNVELRWQDILDFPAAEGKFDYIIAHGIFSWVPDPVREKILAICAEHLTENGIAYISYNALPGWNVRRSFREMARYHTKPFKDTAVQVQQARALAKFLRDSVPTENNAYGLLLRGELDAVAQQSDGYLLHDSMEEENTGFYFHEFMERAGRHALQYLSEPSLSQMLAANFPENVRETLGRIGAGIVAQEQYMDFLRNRTFRQTLLCRLGRPIQRNVDQKLMRQFSFQGLLQSVAGEIDLKPGVAVEFATPHGATVKTDGSFVKAVLHALAVSPSAAFSFDELLAMGRERSRPLLGAVADDRDQVEEALLASNMLDLYSKGVLEIWAEPIAAVTKVPEKPAVSALMRYQAKSGKYVTNRTHQPLPADDLARHVLAGCDGTRTIEELLVYLVECATKGNLQVKRGTVPVTDPKELEALMRPLIGNGLKNLMRLGFLTP